MEKGKQVTGNEVSGEKAMEWNLYPVEPSCCGEGLPYAPVDWPNPGDTWRWWVGTRTGRSGFYQDRLVYLPKRLRCQGSNNRFKSKPSLAHYISSQFPNSDVDEFFASFSWMVPSTRHHWPEGHCIMEKGKRVTGNEVLGEKAMKLNLYPVGPNCSGEGLPYAPVDWPNPGDTWHWWVGTRTGGSGFYQDRFLYLPKRLCCQGSSNNRFNSKPSLAHFISSQFPNSDVDEFFASFSWMVPSTRHHWNKDLFPHVPVDEIASKRTNEAPCNSQRTKKARPATSQAFPRRRTRQSYKISAESDIRDDESVIDLCSLTDDSTSDGSGYSKCGSESQIHLEDVAPDQSTSSSCHATNASEAEEAQKVEELHVQFCEEDVDACLKSLEHILSQHDDETQLRTPFTYVGSDMAEEMSTHRRKLSSILALDFSCLLSLKYLEEISHSVEKLGTDPILTVDQLLKLKLVEEIPKAGEVFLCTKGIAEQANKFFSDLGAMKKKVSSIKREFNELTKGEGELQSQIDSKSSLVRETDEQIAQLQCRKAQLVRDLELKNKAKDKVVAEQKITSNSISAVMREIKTASAEIPVWEMKKKTAEKRMAEILASSKHQSINGRERDKIHGLPRDVTYRLESPVCDESYISQTTKIK